MADRSCSGTISEKIALLFVPDLPAAHASGLPTGSSAIPPPRPAGRAGRSSTPNSSVVRARHAGGAHVRAPHKSALPPVRIWAPQWRSRRHGLRPAPAAVQSTRGLGAGAPACARVGLGAAHQLMHAPIKNRTAAYLLKLSPVAVMSCARARGVTIVDAQGWGCMRGLPAAAPSRAPQPTRTASRVHCFTVRCSLRRSTQTQSKPAPGWASCAQACLPGASLADRRAAVSARVQPIHSLFWSATGRSGCLSAHARHGPGARSRAAP